MPRKRDRSRRPGMAGFWCIGLCLGLEALMCPVCIMHINGLLMCI